MEALALIRAGMKLFSVILGELKCLGVVFFFCKNVFSKVVIMQENTQNRAGLEYRIRLQQEIGGELQIYQKKGKNPSKLRTKRNLSGAQGWAN